MGMVLFFLGVVLFGVHSFRRRRYVRLMFASVLLVLIFSPAFGAQLLFAAVCAYAFGIMFGIVQPPRL